VHTSVGDVFGDIDATLATIRIVIAGGQKNQNLCYRVPPSAKKRWPGRRPAAAAPTESTGESRELRGKESRPLSGQGLSGEGQGTDSLFRRLALSPRPLATGLRPIKDPHDDMENAVFELENEVLSVTFHANARTKVEPPAVWLRAEGRGPRDRLSFPSLSPRPSPLSQ
jgi:hypothetical protein